MLLEFKPACLSIQFPVASLPRRRFLILPPIQMNTERRPGADSPVGQRRRRWPTAESAPGRSRSARRIGTRQQSGDIPWTSDPHKHGSPRDQPSVPRCPPPRGLSAAVAGSSPGSVNRECAAFWSVVHGLWCAGSPFTTVCTPQSMPAYPPRTTGDVVLMLEVCWHRSESDSGQRISFVGVFH